MLQVERDREGNLHLCASGQQQQPNRSKMLSCFVVFFDCLQIVNVSKVGNAPDIMDAKEDTSLVAAELGCKPGEGSHNISDSTQ